jgi:hypothetical protein
MLGWFNFADAWYLKSAVARCLQRPVVRPPNSSRFDFQVTWDGTLLRESFGNVVVTSFVIS